MTEFSNIWLSDAMNECHISVHYANTNLNPYPGANPG